MKQIEIAEIMQDVTRRLEPLRTSRCWSQAFFAEKLGIGQTMYYYLAHGKTKLSAKIFKRLIAFLFENVRL